MVVSETGKQLIRTCEGVKQNAYLDSVGVPTIGWGSTFMPNGERVKIGDYLSLADCNTLLDAACKQRDGELNKLLGGTILTQNQYDALFDFMYNLGVGNLASSTLLKKVLASPSDATIPDEFKKWIHAGASILPGLVKRRGLEISLWTGQKISDVVAGWDTFKQIIEQEKNSDFLTQNL
jgi:lysozyme